MPSYLHMLGIHSKLNPVAAAPSHWVAATPTELLSGSLVPCSAALKAGTDIKVYLDKPRVMSLGDAQEYINEYNDDELVKVTACFHCSIIYMSS